MNKERQEGCVGRHKVEAGSHNWSHVSLDYAKLEFETAEG